MLSAPEELHPSDPLIILCWRRQAHKLAM